MLELNLNNSLEIRNAGIKALKDALGPVGMVRFLQQYEKGSGDFTKEKYDIPDMTFAEFEQILAESRG